MLPPVPATSVAHAMQANQRQASAEQVIAEAPVQDAGATSTTRPTAAGTTSSMELLGLSGQMRLAQSLSVFAETLGSLLKLPRREGEALADYSKRLSAAINALNTQERARLQAQLNQIMQGATLRLLTELLKEPSGPDAARLAVQIEIAQYQERDLAARHVVSSYRQNNGNDLPALVANGNATPVKAQSGAGETSSDTAQPLMIQQDDADAGVHTAGPKDGATTTRTIANKSDVATGLQPETADAAERDPTRSAGVEIDDTLADRPAEEPEAPAQRSGGLAMGNRQIDGKASQAATSEVRLQQPQAGETATSDATPVATHAPGEDDGVEMKPARIYDAAALARLAHGNGNAVTASIARAIVDGFQADWIADLLTGEAEHRQAQRLAPGQGTGLLQSGSEDMDTPANAEMLAAKPTSGVTPPVTDSPEPLVSALPHAANPLSTPAVIAALPDAAFEKALLGMTAMPREVPGHPLVPKNGTPEFDDTQDHEIRRKSPVGDDEQPPKREHQGYRQQRDGEEQNAAEDEQHFRPVSAADAGDQSEPPEATPAAKDPRQMPRQHLSDHPEPSAEDFYRRLAALE